MNLNIPPEALAQWRTEAIERGGTPTTAMSPAQTALVYASNRIVALIDQLTEPTP